MNIKEIDSNFQISNIKESNTTFYPINNNFIVHGLLWYQINKNFNRLNNQDFIDEKIDVLQKHPSGAYLSFQTNSTKMDLKVEILHSSYMAHMSAIGQTGLDLYIKYNGKYIFLANTKIDKTSYEINLFSDLPKKMHQYRLYLPLYIELKSLEIGLDKDAILDKYEEIISEKIVCYGTSITQGGCATRPGMNFSSIIGRYLNYEIINFGFSGNAHLHEKMANIIQSINNMKYLIIEVEANAGAIGVLKDRLENFLDIILSKTNPKIFLISHYPYSMSLFKKEIKDKMNDYKTYQKSMAMKYPNLEFIDGEDILQSLNYDETVDGIHLTDLGFYQIANVIIGKILR